VGRSWRYDRDEVDAWIKSGRLVSARTRAGQALHFPKIHRVGTAFAAGVNGAEDEMRTTLRAIDLFAGCGGLSLGLQRAGFNVLSAVEIDDLASGTYRSNHPNVRIVHRDIRDVAGKELAGDEAEIEVIAGCPPCQGFSRVRRHNQAKAARDDRNDLVAEFTRVVEEVRPRAVFMENVPGIESDRRFGRFLRRLEAIGYVVTWDLLELAEYGVPQSRTRVVVLAGMGFEIPMPKPCRKLRTVKSAIRSLPAPSRSRNVLHRETTQHSPVMLARIRATPKDGGSRRAWPENLRLKCHDDCDGFKDVYGRMAWNEPSPTITGGCINASKGRFLHPVQNRAITLLEAALLQTFPRRYHFCADRGRYAIAEMIGNALPPVFAERVGWSIAAALVSHPAKKSG
jgi:DNA (cytosine-5)-methyltransferase 1